MTGQLLGDPRAGGEQLHQLGGRQRVLDQQLQVVRPARDPLDENQQAVKHRAPDVLAARRAEQQRQQPVQATLAMRILRAHAGGAEQLA